MVEDQNAILISTPSSFSSSVNNLINELDFSLFEEANDNDSVERNLAAMFSSQGTSATCVKNSPSSKNLNPLLHSPLRMKYPFASSTPLHEKDQPLIGTLPDERDWWTSWWLARLPETARVPDLMLSENDSQDFKEVSHKRKRREEPQLCCDEKPLQNSKNIWTQIDTFCDVASLTFGADVEDSLSYLPKKKTVTAVDSVFIVRPKSRTVNTYVTSSHGQLVGTFQVRSKD